jgi:hypothetical protein
VNDKLSNSVAELARKKKPHSRTNVAKSSLLSGITNLLLHLTALPGEKKEDIRLPVRVANAE